MKPLLLLLCFVLVCFNCVYSKGGGRGGGGRGGRGGGGIFGSIWGKSSSRHTYPASTGYSGLGSGGSHGYPLSPSGLSGLSKTPGFRYGRRYGSYRFNYVPRVPSFYTVPQYVYVNQYRQSNSRFNNLLIGLTMYNMGRSHVLHHHYYHDSYYRRSSSSASSNADHAVTSTSAEEKDDEDDATCLMRVTENKRAEVLKIPCAIVTTFAEGTRKVPFSSNTTTTVCVNSSVANSTSESAENASNYEHKSEAVEKDMTRNEIICKSTIKSVNPLSVTGSPLNTTGMECTIEIWTRQDVITNEVDCEVLLKYAKMPVPQNKDSYIMPPRSELKEMLEHPPWWLALFLAV